MHILNSCADSTTRIARYSAHAQAPSQPGRSPGLMRAPRAGGGGQKRREQHDPCPPVAQVQPAGVLFGPTRPQGREAEELGAGRNHEPERKLLGQSDAGQRGVVQQMLHLVLAQQLNNEHEGQRVIEIPIVGILVDPRIAGGNDGHHEGD